MPIKKIVYSWGFLAATNRWQCFTYPAVSMGHIWTRKLFFSSLTFFCCCRRGKRCHVLRGQRVVRQGRREVRQTDLLFEKFRFERRRARTLQPHLDDLAHVAVQVEVRWSCCSVAGPDVSEALVVSAWSCGKGWIVKCFFLSFRRSWEAAFAADGTNVTKPFLL